MLRASPYIVPGMVYQVTHRCHDRKFLQINAHCSPTPEKHVVASILEFPACPNGCGPLRHVTYGLHTVREP